MYATLVSIHTFLRIIVLVIVPIALLVSYYAWRQKQAYTKFHELIARLNIGINHAQFLVGLILLTHSPKVDFNQLSTAPHLRYSILHPVVMLLAIAFVTFSFVLTRNKTESATRHKLSFRYNLIAYVLLLIGQAISLLP